MTWIVAYDISKNKRRRAICKSLQNRGIRVQKSVFLVQCGTSQIRKLLEHLEGLIDAETDRVCAWPLIDAWRARQIVYPAEAAPLQEVFVIA